MTKNMKIQKKRPYYKDYSIEWPKYKAQTKEKHILIFTKISGLIVVPKHHTDHHHCHARHAGPHREGFYGSVAYHLKGLEICFQGLFYGLHIWHRRGAAYQNIFLPRNNDQVLDGSLLVELLWRLDL